MRTIALAALLVGCSQPAPPACAENQQNPCKCGDLDGMQMCKAGAYGPCECATVENEAEAAREEYVRQKGEAATREQMIRAEQEQLLKEREALDAKVRAAKSDAERARWSAELAVLDEQIAKNRAELGGS